MTKRSDSELKVELFMYVSKRPFQTFLKKLSYTLFLLQKKSFSSMHDHVGKF